VSDTSAINAALRKGGIIDITTTGRTSGQPRRIEIVFHNVAGRIYISGMPGTRAWIANLSADPHLIFHLKKGLQADLPATARIITDPAERQPLIEHVVDSWNRRPQLQAFLDGAPLIEVTFDDQTLLGDAPSLG
jgi:hypothetical protein